MEQFILEYIFQKLNEDLIGHKDHSLLVYILQQSNNCRWSKQVEFKARAASDTLGFSRPTIKECLENLEFAGLITYETKRGRYGKTVVDINFIEELMSTSHFNEDSDKSVNRAIQNNIPKINEDFSTTYLKKGSVVLNVNQSAIKSSKCKLTLQLELRKKVDIADLKEIPDKRIKNLKDFFASHGSILPEDKIKVVSVIDDILFNGLIFNAIETESVQKKAKNKSSEYSKKEFVLNEETMRHIPLKLHNHRESYLSEDYTFIEAYKEWMEYKKNDKGDPVGYKSAIENFKWLATLDNPVECIKSSIRKEANGIFNPKQGSQSSNGYSSSNRRMNIKKFD